MECVVDYLTIFTEPEGNSNYCSKIAKLIIKVTLVSFHLIVFQIFLSNIKQSHDFHFENYCSSSTVFI